MVPLHKQDPASEKHVAAEKPNYFFPEGSV